MSRVLHCFLTCVSHFDAKKPRFHCRLWWRIHVLTWARSSNLQIGHSSMRWPMTFPNCALLFRLLLSWILLRPSGSYPRNNHRLNEKLRASDLRCAPSCRHNDIVALIIGNRTMPILYFHSMLQCLCTIHVKLIMGNSFIVLVLDAHYSKNFTPKSTRC